MNPEMQTTLLNTYPPNLIETILKALREQLKEIDPLTADEEIASPATEIPLGYGKKLEKEDSGLMSKEEICKNTSC